MPEASSLRAMPGLVGPAARQASMATPAKPITRPSMRDAVGLSLSQAQATSAPNIGTVAFKIDDSPVLICSNAKERHTNGMPEFSMPIKNVRRQCFFSSGSRPRSHTSGNKNSAAMATRTAAVGNAPNSTAPRCMNKNDAPQMAARSTKSAPQGRGGREAGNPLKTNPSSWARLRGQAVQFYGPAHRHNP